MRLHDTMFFIIFIIYAKLELLPGRYALLYCLKLITQSAKHDYTILYIVYSFNRLRIQINGNT